MFSRTYTGQLKLLPCLHDWHEEGGVTKSEYFLQDLLVARMIYAAKPDRHVDIGSRVDGFVANVASFREIEVFDVRPITAQIPGIVFKQADLMNPLPQHSGYCDSLSCLHALEHFGLGRYGDPVDPEGYRRGFVNMSKLLKEKGYLYLSVPLGTPRVEFNAHRIFDPNVILELAAQSKLGLISFTSIGQDGAVQVVDINWAQFSELSNMPYSLGVFTFCKRSEN